MRGTDHLALGAVVGAVTANSIGMGPKGAAFCIPCMIGSLFPDIDIASSKMGKKIGPASSIINMLFGHRGFVHTPLCAAICAVIIYMTSYNFAPDLAFYITCGFLSGFAAHLIQDTLTKGGIMWLFPIKLKIRLTNLKSDSPMCFVVTVILAVLYVFLFYMASNIFTI